MYEPIKTLLEAFGTPQRCYPKHDWHRSDVIRGIQQHLNDVILDIKDTATMLSHES